MSDSLGPARSRSPLRKRVVVDDHGTSLKSPITNTSARPPGVMAPARAILASRFSVLSPGSGRCGQAHEFERRIVGQAQRHTASACWRRRSSSAPDDRDLAGESHAVAILQRHGDVPGRRRCGPAHPPSGYLSPSAAGGRGPPARSGRRPDHTACCRFTLSDRAVLTSRCRRHPKGQPFPARTADRDIAGQADGDDDCKPRRPRTRRANAAVRRARRRQPTRKASAAARDRTSG